MAKARTKKRRSKSGKVRDLAVKSVASAGVKGGTPKLPKLYEAAAKGTHLPEITID